MQFYTIGAYHSSADEFFQKLIDHNIDTFCDIRQKRGVRGSQYSYVNSKRLQDKLAVLGINYEHVTGLAPTDEIRKVQTEIDKEQGVKYRDREQLSNPFIQLYSGRVLNKFDLHSFVSNMEKSDSNKVVLFCVEQNPNACHRSIVASELKKMGYPIIHL